MICSVSTFLGMMFHLYAVLFFKSTNFIAEVLVANLSYLLEDKKATERLITNVDGKDEFLLTESGLLFTRGPLDREQREVYMFTILVGRRGLRRGGGSQQAIQVKVGWK